MKKIICYFISLLMISSLQASNSSTSAYGELLTAMYTPWVQLQFPYNLNTDYVTTTVVGTGSVTQSSNLAVLQTGTGSTGSATLLSDKRLPYKPGQGCTCMFTAVFTTGVASNTQIIGVGNTQDGFFFGYNGTAFGIMRRSNGSDTWVAQTSWNGDRFDGTGASGVTLVPTNGNVYRIQYQWLGFGIINFLIENPSTGEFVLVHSIAYANSATTPSLRNPSLQLMAATTNAGNTTNITLSTSSMAALIGGRPSVYKYMDTRNSAANTTGKNVNSSANRINILTIRNNTTFAGVNNQVMVYPDYLDVLETTGGTETLYFSLVLNGTLGGVPAFTNVNANTSVVSFDTAGTTVTGGTTLLYFSGSVSIKEQRLDLSDLRICLIPGDTLTICATRSAGNNTVLAALSWTEGF